MPEAGSISGAGADAAGLKAGGYLQCPRLLQTAAWAHHPGCRVKTLLICSWSVGRDTGRDGQRCSDTKAVSETGVRESLRHTRSNRKKHTHTPRRQKSQEAGEEVRKSKKVGGREGKEVGKGGKKSGCGRQGQRAGLKRQEGSREIFQHPASSPAGGSSGAEVGESFLQKAMS